MVVSMAGLNKFEEMSLGSSERPKPLYRKCKDPLDSSSTSVNTLKTSVFVRFSTEFDRDVRSTVADLVSVASA